MTEANILEIRIRMESLICERDGMTAENAQRQHVGDSMAYTSEAFYILATQFGELATTLTSLMER